MSLSVYCPVGARHDYESRTTMVAATPVKYILQQYEKIVQLFVVRNQLVPICQAISSKLLYKFLALPPTFKAHAGQNHKDHHAMKSHVFENIEDPKMARVHHLCVLSQVATSVVAWCPLAPLGFHSSTIYSALRASPHGTLDIL